MKILYVANINSIHTKKWVTYFLKKYGDIDLVDGKCRQDIKDSLMYFKPDIVHIHYAGWGALWVILTGFKPIVLTVWGSDVLVNQKNFFKRLVLKFILSKASLITCDAKHMIKALIHLGVDENKIERINFGVDTELFKPNPIPHTRPTIISLRSLELIYDVTTLIRSIPLVLKQIPNALFIIAGDGTQKQTLIKLSEYYKVENNVVFCGQIENNELPKLLNKSDVYVSTSLSDAGISASTAEAMACGLPVIVTDVAENRIWVGERYVFTSGYHAKLGELIISALQNKEQSRAMGILNRQMIVENNDYEIEMNKMAALYETL
jgi:glycosyltransferase involved in cell wall biosynthesis